MATTPKHTTPRGSRRPATKAAGAQQTGAHNTGVRKPGARKNTTPTKSPRRIANWVRSTRNGRTTITLMASALALLALLTLFTGRPDAGLFAPNTPTRIPGDADGDGTPDSRDPDSQSALTATGFVVDLDNDGTPDTHVGTGKNKTPIQTLADNTNAIITNIAPEPATTFLSETLLTPTGKNWWSLVLSITDETRLNTLPPPNTRWYAVTSQNPASATAENRPYQSLHVGFANTTAARDWVTRITNSDPSGNWFPMLRKTVVTISPTRANPNDEPFADAPRINITPTVATWSINLATRNEQQAQDSLWPDNIRAYYEHLGYTDETVWNAAATNPDGPWVGQLTGYNTKAVDPIAAARDIQATLTPGCDLATRVCTAQESGATDYFNYATYRNHNNEGHGIRTTLLPANPPKDIALTFGYVPGLITGILNGTRQVTVGQRSVTQGWITNDHTMTVRYLTGPIPPMPEDTPPPN